VHTPKATLRAAVPSDAPLFYEVIASTMRGFIEATWGAWDEERVQRESRDVCKRPEAKVALLELAEVGVLVVCEEATHTQVEQLYLLPQYQRLGLGGELMAAVLRTSSRAGKPVRLRVLRVNPARSFYEKLGFTVQGESNEFIFMERAA
jgi:GNAT superfamily N-acetyltransferase